MIRLGILGSTRGTNLAPLVQAKFQIEWVISNKQNAGILQRAAEFNLPFKFIDPKQEPFEQTVTKLFYEANVELIVLIGYMRILSSDFVKEWENKIINVHPSLLPKHARLMNLQVHQAVLAAREKETGCTVHFVTEQVDEGPIILQKRCDVLKSDTAESLRVRVQALEGPALVEAIISLRGRQ